MGNFQKLAPTLNQESHESIQQVNASEADSSADRAGMALQHVPHAHQKQELGEPDNQVWIRLSGPEPRRSAKTELDAE